MFRRIAHRVYVMVICVGIPADDFAVLRMLILVLAKFLIRIRAALLVNHNRAQRLQPLHGIINAARAFFGTDAAQSKFIVIVYAFRLRAVSRYPVIARQAVFPQYFSRFSIALFPFRQFIEDHEKIVINILSSVGIILQGYLLAAAAAIILGLLLGSSERLGNVATYIAKFLGAIPPIVYIPYGIALLPTFRSVSVFVIFLATFWPVLAGTMSGVMNVDKKTLDSARVLNVNRFTMLFSVILPASLPQIFIGCNQGLTVAFVLLTSAEMIGAQSGLGFYIKNYSDFGDYTRTLVGLIVIGIVIVVISFGFNKIQKYLLRWKH